MIVRIYDERGDVLWSRGGRSGVTSLSHREDGTIDEIILALELALHHAKGERDKPLPIHVDVAKQNSAGLCSLLDR